MPKPSRPVFETELTKEAVENIGATIQRAFEHIGKMVGTAVKVLLEIKCPMCDHRLLSTIDQTDPERKHIIETKHPEWRGIYCPEANASYITEVDDGS